MRISPSARYGGGVTPDSSGLGNSGKLMGDAVVMENEEREGQVLALDGTGDFVRIENSDSLQLGGKDFIVGAWVCPVQDAATGTILSKWSPAEAAWALELSNGVAAFRASADGLVENAVTLSGGDALQSGVWAYIEARRTDEKIILKLNDQEVAQVAFTDSVHASPAPLFIGARCDATGEAESCFMGLIDEVRFSREHATPAGVTSGEVRYVYNNANQLVKEISSAWVKQYYYNKNGGNTRIVKTLVDGTSGGVVDMTYDSLGRMTGWTDGANTETHAYAGADWKRASTTANGVETRFAYDGDNVVADYVNGSLAKSYITPFLDQNLMMTDAATGETYYYTQDGLGSVRTLTNSAGAVVNKYDYTAFGESYAANTVEAVSQRYTYTGREKSSVGAPMYYRWRHYAPEIGRFTRRDPIGYEGGINVYGYVNGNPAFMIDPLGTLSASPCSPVWSGWYSIEPRKGRRIYFTGCEHKPKNSGLKFNCKNRKKGERAKNAYYVCDYYCYENDITEVDDNGTIIFTRPWPKWVKPHFGATQTDAKKDDKGNLLGFTGVYVMYNTTVCCDGNGSGKEVGPRTSPITTGK